MVTQCMCKEDTQSLIVKAGGMNQQNQVPLNTKVDYKMVMEIGNCEHCEKKQVMVGFVLETDLWLCLHCYTRMEDLII